MKVFIIGATGGTGAQLLIRALQEGHEVTAFVRNPAKISMKHERLHIVSGDVLNADSVTKAMEGQEAVLSALGPSAGTKPGTLISEGTRNIINAMKQNKAKRFVFESGIMVGEGSGMNFVKRTMLGIFRNLNRDLFEDKVRAEKLVNESGLEWIIVRPPALKHIPAKGNYRVGSNLNVDLIAGLSHSDVADFMVKCVIDKTYLGKVIDISY